MAKQLNELWPFEQSYIDRPTLSHAFVVCFA